MSVKKGQKPKGEVEKGVQGLVKKLKTKSVLSTQSTKTEKFSNKNTTMKSKTDCAPSTESSDVPASDKHSKLKDRKQFKRMKFLEFKRKKLCKRSSGGDSEDKKTMLIQNKPLKVGKTEKNNGERVSQKSALYNKHDTVQDNKQSKKHAKKKGKCLKWKQNQMAKKLDRINKTSKGGQKKNIVLKEKVHIAKTAVEATANWTRLQEGMSGTTQSSTSRKRKIPYDRIRNPKLRKMEEGSSEGVDKDAETKEPEIWFDDVDEILLDRKPATALPDTNVESTDNAEGSKTNNPLVKPGAFKGVTKIVGMDCEMVGVGDGTDNMLARVSIVNQFGEPVYDKFVKPKEEVVDYRTHVSGVRPGDLKDAEVFEEVQKDVAGILKGRTLVGHAIKNDLKVLYLSHPKRKIRDTSTYKPFKQLTNGRTPSLKKLSEKLLSVKVQEGEHNSIQDAQATMRLYTMYRKQWEGDISKKKKGKKIPKGQTGKT